MFWLISFNNLIHWDQFSNDNKYFTPILHVSVCAFRHSSLWLKPNTSYSYHTLSLQILPLTWHCIGKPTKSFPDLSTTITHIIRGTVVFYQYPVWNYLESILLSRYVSNSVREDKEGCSLKALIAPNHE